MSDNAFIFESCAFKYMVSDREGRVITESLEVVLVCVVERAQFWLVTPVFHLHLCFCFAQVMQGSLRGTHPTVGFKRPT